MNYRFILSILFIIEMIVGSVLVILGSGFIKAYGTTNYFLIGLGMSVFLAHALEYFLLFKLQVVGETCPMCHGLGTDLINVDTYPAPACPKCGGSGKRP